MTGRVHGVVRCSYEDRKIPQTILAICHHSLRFSQRLGRLPSSSGGECNNTGRPERSKGNPCNCKIEAKIVSAALLLLTNSERMVGKGEPSGRH